MTIYFYVKIINQKIKTDVFLQAHIYFTQKNVRKNSC